MKLVAMDFLEERQNFLFHTDTEEIVMTVNWQNTYEPVSLEWVELPKTTEEIIRQNIQQIGLYTDNTDVVFRLNTLLSEYIGHYRLPMSIQPISLPNRELMIISVATSFEIEKAKALIKAITEPDISKSDLPEIQLTEEEDDDNGGEKIILVMDGDFEEVIEETEENKTKFSIGEVSEE